MAVRFFWQDALGERLSDKQLLINDNGEQKMKTVWNIATKWPRIVLAACMILCIAGCHSAPKTSRALMPTPIGLTLTLGLQSLSAQNVIPVELANDEIPVFVVSGRNVEDAENTLDPFGSNRDRHPNLGVAYVKIGEKQSAGRSRQFAFFKQKSDDSYAKFQRFELAQSPLKLDPWVIKDETVRHTGNPWMESIKRQLDQSTQRSLCIFVHGYNTEFIGNTILAAELYHYLGRQGAVVSYEWPSKSKLLGYMADKGSATYSIRNFRGMISNIAKECHADSITIIGHSAGTPIVVGAMRELRLLEHDMTPQQLQEKYKIERVVLAAPDMDLLEFMNGVYDRFHEVARNVVVYASPNDRALSASEKIYGSERLGRSVGRLEDWEVAVLNEAAQIELVDASKTKQKSNGFLEHSYFHSDPWVSSDIVSFVLGGPPKERGLVRAAGEMFWEFPDDYPDKIRQLIDSNPVLNPIRADRQAFLQRGVRR
jgi:esterase/lipase superfamily enzyme